MRLELLDLAVTILKATMPDDYFQIASVNGKNGRYQLNRNVFREMWTRETLR